MSLQLQPQKNFTIVRQLQNPFDTATYFVQAVVRNAQTDAILATLSLTDKGSQRFKTDWQVPADPSGEGFYISIVTNVYTDAGFTTKSENYGTEQADHLVFDRINTTKKGGGGGSIGLSDIRKIMQEEIAKAQKQDDAEEVTEDAAEASELPTILAAIDNAVASIKESVSSNDYNRKIILEQFKKVLTAIAEKPVTEKTDLSSLSVEFQKITHAIADKPVTESTDLSPVISALSEDKNKDLIVVVEKILRLLPEVVDIKIRKALKEKMLSDNPDSEQNLMKRNQLTTLTS